MPQIPLCEKLARYKPADSIKKILEHVTEYEISAEKASRALVVTACFDIIVPKRILYAIENEIASVYQLSYVRLFPKYNKELFEHSYLPEALTEANREYTASNGFFNDYSTLWNDKGSKVKIFIPFDQPGINLLDIAGTSNKISNIIEREFNLRIDVEIGESTDCTDKNAEFVKSRELEIQAQSELIEKARIEAMSRRAAEENAAESEQPAVVHLPRVMSLHPEISPLKKINETQIRVGLLVFDISSPEFVAGNNFDLSSPTPIRELTGSLRSVVVFGRVFEVTSKESRRGDTVNISAGITDKDSSIYIRANLPTDAANELLSILVTGNVIAVNGSVKLDRFASKSDPSAPNEPVLRYDSIALIKTVGRKDNYGDGPQDKRIELHVHTTMSAMDATIPPDALVKTAQKFGHEAVAVTDHANLQAYPMIMETSEKLGMKVIYGMEAYFVDDTARSIYGSLRPSFNDEMIVFDLETTGLSAFNNKITEIGAVRIKDGKVIDRFNTFVDPEVHISDEITNLTGITDDMVKGAPKIKDALEAFIEYAGNCMLIAHNAGFDISFLRHAAQENGIEFEPTYLDTVAMSRFVNRDLNTHKLDTLADYFGLGDFNHHRASDDAEMLALIYYAMTDKLAKEGICDTETLLKDMSENADPLRLPMYHMILLVKNKNGLKNLYRLISDGYLKYFRGKPRLPKTLLDENREGLIVGSACEAGELYRAILDSKPESELIKLAEYYDYLEIQPTCNNMFLVNTGKVADTKSLEDINRRIINLGKKTGRPVVATTDAHFMEPEDEIFRKILLSGMKFSDADNDVGLYFRTTSEMLDEFAYLGDELAREVVITNTHTVASWIDFENIRPIPKGNYPPHIDGSEDELTNMCYNTAKSLYGDPLPDIVKNRLEKELGSIIKNGFAVLYIIAQKLVNNSMEKGYLVGSRGSVGSSFVATMAGITRVNPLPPHYRCPNSNCLHSEFFPDGFVNGKFYGSGFDLPSKVCPECGEKMITDGHDIPFETFLGFYGDKSPDIDLNFSGDVQADAHAFTEKLFGKGYAFRAGTIGTLAPKTSYGFAAKYLDDHEISLPHAHLSYLADGNVGVKRTTGQHPGGIIVVPREYDVYDFTPVQHPADNSDSDIITTHFTYTYLHETILKLDILGHDIPTKLKRLEEYSGISVLSVPMNDPKVLRLFTSTEPLGVSPDQLGGINTGTLGLPEMGTKLVRGVLTDAQPKTFADLLQISGLTHGTGVWAGNADELIKSKTATISEVIGTRDDIMLRLIADGLDKALSFKIMEMVRKNKKGVPIPSEMVDAMREKGVSEWYIESLAKIRYMFPKAHAAAYVMDAITLGWFKVYHPVEFYAAYFSAAPDGVDAEIIMRGHGYVKQKIDELQKLGFDATQKDADTLDALILINEYMARGYEFLPVDLKKSAAFAFLPENGKIRLPFAALPGVGGTAAEKIVAAREENEIYSIEDLQKLAQISKTVVDMLDRNGVLRDLNETNQFTLFARTDVKTSQDSQPAKAAKPSKSKAAVKTPDVENNQISMFG